MALQIVSREKWQRLESQEPQIDGIVRTVAAKWPDASLRAEGRMFALLDDSQGSIVHRVIAAGQGMSARERERLQVLRGAIVEIGSDVPPMLYRDFADLAADWIALHATFGAPFSSAEFELLTISLSDADWQRIEARQWH